MVLTVRRHLSTLLHKMELLISVTIMNGVPGKDEVFKTSFLVISMGCIVFNHFVIYIVYKNFWSRLICRHN